MTRLVLDTNVVLTWFTTNDEPRRADAVALRLAFERGDVDVVVPDLVALEVLNVAGRRWAWPEADLAELAAALADLPWTVAQPPLPVVARWVAHGLTAYDAAYVALADSLACRVVTADERMLAVAPDRTVPLAAP